MATSGITSILFFSIITTIYYIIRVFTRNKSSTINMSLEWVYFGLVIIVEYILQYNLTLEMCGEAQSSLLYTTFLPWLLIFGTLKIVLQLFPSWLRPFSNVFGFLAISVGGRLKKVWDNILIKQSDSQSDKIIETLGDLYNDSSIFINKIRYNEFDDDWDTLVSSGLVKKNIGDGKEKLRDLINIKNIVSEYFWYLLTGILVSSISYNSIMNVGCNISAKEVAKRHKDYEKKQQEIREDRGEKAPPKKYKSYD
jgi:hypothetical protein